VLWLIGFKGVRHFLPVTQQWLDNQYQSIWQDCVLYVAADRLVSQVWLFDLNFWWRLSMAESDGISDWYVDRFSINVPA
jgi:hypothetical protein